MREKQGILSSYAYLNKSERDFDAEDEVQGGKVLEFHKGKLAVMITIKVIHLRSMLILYPNKKTEIL